MYTQETQRPKRKKILLKWIKRLGIFTGILIGTFLAAAVIIVYFFEDDVKKFAINQINKQLNTKIEVKEINLSLLKKFPNASLEFVDVKCKEMVYDSTATPQNLLEAESVFLQFSVWDIFRKKYTFKRLDIKNGKAFLKIDKDGNMNFDILKKKPKDPKKKKKKKGDAFRFNRFTLQNMQVAFLHIPQKQVYKVRVKQFSLSGKFSDKQHTSRSKGKFFVELIRINDSEYLSNKNISYSTKLQVDYDQQLFTIKKGKLGIENLAFEVAGYFKGKPDPYIDLDVKGQDLDIRSFLSLLPPDKRSFEKEYKSRGNFYANATVKGKILPKKMPFISVSFGVNNGQITHKPSGQVMKQVNVKGSFTNGTKGNAETTEINISQFSGRLEKSSINGSFRLANFDKPEMQFTTHSDIDLEEIATFLPLDNVEEMQGRMKINMEFSGRTADGKQFTIHDYQRSQMKGDAELSGVRIRIVGQKNTFHDCNGSFSFENSDATVHSLTGFVGQSDFTLKGTVINLPGYLLLPGTPLHVDASFRSKKIVLDEWLVKKDTENEVTTTANKEDAYHLIIPANVNFDLDISVDELQFRRFTARNIKGNVDIKERLFGAHGMSFKSNGGTIYADGVVNGTDPSELRITAHGKFRDIDMPNLFYAFENFGQKTLEDRHLKGTVNSDVDFRCTFSNTLEANLKSLYVSADVTVAHGELNNFKPMESLSKFIRVEELRSIKFAELKNRIEIKDEAIHIPKMEVRSSAINLVLSGTHYFDNRIDYHFNLLLKDILAQKFRRKKKESEFGEIIEEEGGARVFIKMTGTVDKPKIAYDHKGVRQKIKEDMKQEKQDIKQMLYEEFGLFKNDSTIKKEKKLPKKKNPNKIDDSDDFEFE